MAEAEFTPETADGTVDVEFTFNAAEFAGKTMVMFEKLYLVKENVTDAADTDVSQDSKDNVEGDNKENDEDNTTGAQEEVQEVLVAVHEDIDDDNQTIYVPQVKTTARDSKSDTSMFYAQKDAKVIDTVTYRNLVPGKTYKVVGTAVDKETGAPLIVNGAEVTSEAEFTAEKASGKVDVVFTFDGSLLAGRTIVMFEQVYYENNLIATHADIEDEAQTLYVPKIQTTALDGERHDHNSVADKSVTIVDTVAYQNLVQGQKYKVTGKLIDKSTGKALVIGGKEVTAETEFIAEGTEGTADVTFKFNGTGLTGKQLVAYEQLYVVTDKGESIIASHEDINDEAQTITMLAPPKPKPKTSDRVMFTGFIMAGIAGLMMLVTTLFRKKAYAIKKLDK